MDEIAEMDKLLDECAKSGNINGLYALIQSDPNYLESFNKVQFVDTPLHKVAAAGCTNYAIEILNLMPSFGRKLNAQGLSPLHLALQEDHHDTVRAMITLDKELIRVKGKEGMTPLHYTAKTNRFDQLAKFLYDCPDSAQDLTNRFQSAAHVALENNNLEAFNVILGWLRAKGREDVLGWKDIEGNTVLHIAAMKNQKQVVKKLADLVYLNEKNYADMTPLDIAETESNIPETESYRKTGVKEVLRRAGAGKASEVTEYNLVRYLSSLHLDFIDRLYRNYTLMQKDLSVDIRNIVLLVPVLVTTATYQPILSPPGGFYQGVANTNISDIKPTATLSFPNSYPWWKPEKSLEGKMVMAKSHLFTKFMPINTMTFILSISAIIFVLPARLYTLILDVCLLFLASGYLTVMLYTSNASNTSLITFSVSTFVLGIIFALKLMYFVPNYIYYSWLTGPPSKMRNLCISPGGQRKIMPYKVLMK